MNVGLPLLAVLLQPALSVYNCSSEYNRTPDNSDLTVDCGATTITLEINLCTAQWAGFSTADLALNGNHNNQECLGTSDDTVVPPVMRYHLPVNHSLDNPCRQSLQIVDEAPDPNGPFSSFASVQSVIITGYIETPRPDQGMISYATDLYYHFSCRYPLEYLLNNTQIVASSVSVATNDNNGTFIDALKMSVFNDSTYQYPLIVPPAGLQLRDSVFVEVKANVTGNFYVLLDHCFGTPTTYNVTHSEQHNFFIGCSVDAKTTVLSNGISKVSHFTFEAFRFLEHRTQSKSSVFLHCLLRLCEPSKCPEILAGCNSKRKRSVTPFGQESGDSATVSAGPLFTAAEEQPDAKSNGNAARGGLNVTGLIVGVVLGSAVAVLMVISGWFALKRFYLSPLD